MMVQLQQTKLLPTAWKECKMQKKPLKVKINNQIKGVQNEKNTISKHSLRHFNFTAGLLFRMLPKFDAFSTRETNRLAAAMEWERDDVTMNDASGDSTKKMDMKHEMNKHWRHENGQTKKRLSLRPLFAKELLN
ncbi:MAG: hypothetical protein MZV64_64660 [Ignavibacteriales bacterium]|nr:hypothetical protein [Ignavibacteriales bacterium]